MSTSLEESLLGPLDIPVNDARVSAGVE